MSPSWYAWLLARPDLPADTARAPSTENSSPTSAALTGTGAVLAIVACLVDATGALRAARPKSRLARSRPSLPKKICVLVTHIVAENQNPG